MIYNRTIILWEGYFCKICFKGPLTFFLGPIAIPKMFGGPGKKKRGEII